MDWEINVTFVDWSNGKNNVMTMKRFTKYCLVFVVGCLTAMAANARTINIDVNTIKGDLTQQLRDRCSKATRNDVVVLNFGEGTYTVSGTIRLECNTVIKGAGRGLTTILLDNGSDRGSFRAFPDDTYFRITGTLKSPITVDISDLTIRLKEHKRIWWQGKGVERYAVKIYHANRVDIHDVDSYLDNANITNFNMHVCSNVTVTNCTISNYNNSETGGCLWIRGEMHNIQVKNNKFYKYGKDETLAIFDRVVDNTSKYVRGKASRTDIFIEDNEFYYGNYKGKQKQDPEANCGMVFSLFTDHEKSNDRCITRNFHLRGNKFYINEVTTRCMYIGFDPADVHEGIYIENNEIINDEIKRNYAFYHKDFEIHDLSNCGDTIHITGNTVRNKALVVNSHGETGYMFMQTRGGIIGVHGNQIVNEVSRNKKTGKSYGMQLIWCQFEGGDVTLTSNVCKGLSHIAYVGGGEGTPLFTLKARNNYFEGDTRVYSHKIKEMNLNFTNNTFRSNTSNFFLQEFAPKGSVVFNSNDVTVTSGDGQFMTHTGKSSTHSMRFERLEVQGNIFKGVRNEKEMFRNVTNVRKRTVRSNRISRY